MIETATEQAEEKEIEDEQVVDAQPETTEAEEQPAANVETTEQAEKKPEAGDQSGEDEELVIEIEGESPTQEQEKEEAPEWVKNTRRENREHLKTIKARDKRIAELERKGEPVEAEIPPMPELWSDEIKGDEALFVVKLRERDGMLAAADAKRKTAEDERKLVDEEVNGRIAKYDKRKIAFGKSISDYDEHVSEAEGNLSELQRNSIAYYFKETAAEVMYYLGKHKPEQLKEIAAIKDPTEMLLAVGELRSKVKASKRKPTTPPEELVRGQSKVTGKDTYLEKLEQSKKAQAGDRTEINNYKRGLREKAEPS